MSLGTAFRAFFASLFNAEVSQRVEEALEGTTQPARIPAPESPAPAARPLRSEAVTLLATLQRESRFVDLLQENLDAFSDAQVGAAARPVLKQTGATIERLLGLNAIVDQEEGSEVSVEVEAASAAYQWLGEGTATSGKLVHHGWQATKVELPEWTGKEADAMVVAPAQIQR